MLGLPNLHVVGVMVMAAVVCYRIYIVYVPSGGWVGGENVVVVVVVVLLDGWAGRRRTTRHPQSGVGRRRRAVLVRDGAMPHRGSRPHRSAFAHTKIATAFDTAATTNTAGSVPSHTCGKGNPAVRGSPARSQMATATEVSTTDTATAGEVATAYYEVATNVGTSATADTANSAPSVQGADMPLAVKVRPPFRPHLDVSPMYAGPEVDLDVDIDGVMRRFLRLPANKAAFKQLQYVHIYRSENANELTWHDQTAYDVISYTSMSYRTKAMAVPTRVSEDSVDISPAPSSSKARLAKKARLRTRRR